MSGSSGYSDFASGLGRDFLDVPVAGFAGLAVAFLAWAAPSDDLVRIAGSSAPGLRLALGALGGVLVFGLVFAFLRRLDHLTAAPGQPTQTAPRARRRDRHPDAPTRRPLSAALELAEPVRSPSATDALPAWLGRASLGQEDMAADRSAGGPAGYDESGPTWSAADQARRDTIFGLMGRLEQGYARHDPVAGAEDPPAGSDPQPASAGADRLQSAIHSLQRLASRRA